MAPLLDEFALCHPTQVEIRGAETFIAAEIALELISEAEQRGIGILGLEGFMIGGKATYPAMGRIADFSRGAEYRIDDFVTWSCAEARRLLEGPWRSPPHGDADQIHRAATGHYMLAFALEQGSDSGPMPAEGGILSR
jgi:hypothetical protein